MNGDDVSLYIYHNWTFSVDRVRKMVQCWRPTFKTIFMVGDSCVIDSQGTRIFLRAGNSVSIQVPRWGPFTYRLVPLTFPLNNNLLIETNRIKFLISDKKDIDCSVKYFEDWDTRCNTLYLDKTLNISLLAR